MTQRALPEIGIGSRGTHSLRSAIHQSLRKAVNGIIGLAGLELVRKGGHDWTDQTQFIPLRETLAAARQSGLSVGDYIDSILNDTPGATAVTIEAMTRLGALERRGGRVVEIGPGSGRYLEKVKGLLAPDHYEIYETSREWTAYLVEAYGVTAQPCDQRSLAGTATASADLVHAHKVFSSINFMPTCRYWPEMARVTRPGGYCVFDIMTESCLDPETIEKWAASDTDAGSYPTATPRQAAVSFFESRGFALVGSFLAPFGHGRTELLVFRKSAEPTA